jgi:hypothetical protein
MVGSMTKTGQVVVAWFGAAAGGSRTIELVAAHPPARVRMPKNPMLLRMPKVC